MGCATRLRRRFSAVVGAPIAGMGIALFGRNIFERRTGGRARDGALATTFAVAVATLYAAGYSPFLHFQF